MAKPAKSYVEAGAHLTEMTKQQTEAFVKGLAKSGDMRRRDAEQLLQLLVSRGRETTDRVSALVQSEVAKQLTTLSGRFDEIESRFEALASSIKDGIVGAAAGMTETVNAPAPASAPDQWTAPEPEAKTSTTQTTAKKSSAKTAKKSSAKTAKKSSTKKSAAKKSAKQVAAKKSGTEPDSGGLLGSPKGEHDPSLHV